MIFLKSNVLVKSDLEINERFRKTMIGTNKCNTLISSIILKYRAIMGEIARIRTQVSRLVKSNKVYMELKCLRLKAGNWTTTEPIPNWDTVIPKLIEIIQIPITPKSRGGINRAIMDTVAKVSTNFKPVEKIDHVNPVSVFWVKVSFVILLHQKSN